MASNNAGPSAGAAGPLSGMAIVIAEDTWHTAIVTQRTIESAGGNVVGVAGNLEDAEQMATTSGCDAIVMDLNLNGHMGHQLAGKLAASGLKVVVVSGYRRPDDLDGRIHAFFEKPTVPEILVDALARPPAI